MNGEVLKKHVGRSLFVEIKVAEMASESTYREKLDTNPNPAIFDKGKHV